EIQDREQVTRPEQSRLWHDADPQATQERRRPRWFQLAADNTTNDSAAFVGAGPWSKGDIEWQIAVRWKLINSKEDDFEYMENARQAVSMRADGAVTISKLNESTDWVPHATRARDKGKQCTAKG